MTEIVWASPKTAVMLKLNCISIKNVCTMPIWGFSAPKRAILPFTVPDFRNRLHYCWITCTSTNLNVKSCIFHAWARHACACFRSRIELIWATPQVNRSVRGESTNTDENFGSGRFYICWVMLQRKMHACCPNLPAPPCISNQRNARSVTSRNRRRP